MAIRSTSPGREVMLTLGELDDLACRTVLLPFKGRIVYDGLLAGYNVTFGGGIRRRLRNYPRTVATPLFSRISGARTGVLG